MKIYIAGPMRGLPEWNRPAFIAAAHRWKADGHVPFSPAAISDCLGYLPETTDGEDRPHLEHVIQMDLACLFATDGIALLSGWESSRGATLEVALAQFLALPIFDAQTLQPLEVPRTPWARDPAWWGSRQQAEKVGDWGDVWRQSAQRCYDRIVAQKIAEEAAMATVAEDR